MMNQFQTTAVYEVLGSFERLLFGIPQNFAKVFMILSIFSSNLINYNHDVYKCIAWLSRRVCRVGLSDENVEHTHEDDRDILLLGREGQTYHIPDHGRPLSQKSGEDH